MSARVVRVTTHTNVGEDFPYCVQVEVNGEIRQYISTAAAQQRALDAARSAVRNASEGQR